MAIYHCTISNVSRKRGSNSCATLAYISGKKIHDDKSDRNFSYSRTERVVETGTLIPDYAPANFSDPERIFNSIEIYDKNADARTAKKFEMALPRELTLTQQKKLVENFIKKNFTDHGYCTTYAIHNDPDNNNPHVHIMVANRPLDKRGRWAKTNKKSYALDEHGKKIPVYATDDDADKIPIKNENGDQVFDKNGTPLYQKVRIRPGKGVEKLWQRVEIGSNLLDQRKFLCQIRANWADECNRFLAPDQQIDHRSNKKRGMWDLPTRHEGNAAREMELRGEMSDRCQYNRDVRLLNAEHRAVRNEIASLQNEIQTLEKTKTEMEVVHPIFTVSDLHKIAVAKLTSARKYRDAQRPGTPARQSASAAYRRAQLWHSATTALMEQNHGNYKVRVASGGGGATLDDIRQRDASAILNAIAGIASDRGFVSCNIKIVVDRTGMDWDLMDEFAKDELIEKMQRAKEQ